AKCDDKGATIVVVKISNSEQIVVGGYNPLFWDSSNSYKSTKDSFIFSFTNKNNFQSANIVHSKNDEYSIQCFSHCGPIFGYSDLYVRYDNDPDIWRSTVHSSYPTLNLP